MQKEDKKEIAIEEKQSNVGQTTNSHRVVSFKSTPIFSWDICEKRGGNFKENRSPVHNQAAWFDCGQWEGQGVLGTGLLWGRVYQWR